MKKYKSERQMLANTLLKNGDYSSTREVFERIAKLIPSAQILAELDEKNQIVYYTAKQIYELINDCGNGMLALGLKDRHIVIAAENSFRYLIADMTIAGGVGTVTPIDKDADAEHTALLMRICDADAVICSAYLVEKMQTVSEILKRDIKIITIDRKVEDLPCFDEIVSLGRQKGNLGKYENTVLDLDKTCMILFTSGTTGMNKGVKFNQRNLAANIINCLDTIAAEEKGNTSMSILPMHHATEINTHIMPRIAAGRLTYINGSMKDMMRNIKMFKPYIITVVPMIANAFYKTIWAQAEKSGNAEKLRKGIKLCKVANKIGVDITHKIFKQVYAPFGGNLKQIVCGGSPLNPEVVSGLRDLGMFVINGYGITECGPLVSMNTDTFNEVHSVGKACPKLSIKLSNVDESGVGELCVKGASVSSGYYKDENATALVFDQDGYFHTGDLAKISDEKIYIVGRSKNLIILDNGKNVYPEELEQAVYENIKYIKECMAFEGKCLIGGKLTDRICLMAYAENVDEETVRKDFLELNRNLEPYKRITYVEITDKEFEKNATKKIIRKAGESRHSQTGGIII